ncbi:hypothetical protein JOF36_000024 [Pseudonocardia parietis]|uniref:Uncharacterized protein n=1 Tax=Pseudonocardia parietis TaxID=570936 RepID=A0ABS4VKQ5_9PSEU|nr:hypothetical protein [Pseudonocardia parietis]
MTAPSPLHPLQGDEVSSGQQDDHATCSPGTSFGGTGRR